MVGEDEGAALNLAMFGFVSPRPGGLDASRSVAIGLGGGRVVEFDIGRDGSGVAFPETACESCVWLCDRGSETGTGGSEGECLGIHGFSFSNHPSCSRRLFLVIEHHECCMGSPLFSDMAFLVVGWRLLPD